jgi:type I restriction enzyme S subunit
VSGADIELPTGWTSIPLKHLADLRSGEAITSDEIEQSGSYPVYGGNGIRGFTENYTHSGERALIGRQGALCGNVNVARGKFWASEHAVVVTPRIPSPIGWLAPLLEWMNLGQHSMTAAQPGLSVDAIRRLPVPLPPPQARSAIADFLDREVAQIDAVIDAQERLVAILRERRSAAITAAVGGDAKLRQDVRARGGSDGELIMRRLGHLAEVFVSNVDKHSHADEVPVRLCNYVDVYRNEEVHPFLNLMTATATETEIARFSLQVGDTVFTKDSETADDIGVPAYVSATAPDFVCGYHLAIARPRKGEVNPKYLFWWLSSVEAARQWEVRATGVTRAGLRQTDMRTLPLWVLDDLARQDAIARHLDGTTARIDEMIDKAQASIALMRERRAALISAAVTGRIDVRTGVQRVERELEEARS